MMNDGKKEKKIIGRGKYSTKLGTKLIDGEKVKKFKMRENIK